MTWLAPSYLLIGVIGALGVVIAHLLARHLPARSILPTARFVPPARPVSATRLSRPSDPLLLALRTVAVLLLAAAFARPVLPPPRGTIIRVIAVDRSREVGDATEAAGAARALLRAGDRLVLFDSAPASALDGAAALQALGHLERSAAAGSLSSGLAGAIGAGSVPSHADSIELVIISPLADGEMDAATPRIRAAWPGRIRLVRIAARGKTRDGSSLRSIDLRADADDPLAATVALAGLRTDDAASIVRLLRDAPSADDTAWVRAAAERVLVVWPREGARVRGWPLRSRTDTVGAVIARGVALVAPFVRSILPPDGRVVARWADGEPAASEAVVGAGCVRHVAIGVAAVGDLALRAGTQRLARMLVGPCAAPGADAMSGASPSSPTAAWLSGTGPLTSARQLARLQQNVSLPAPLVPWLLAAAALTLLVEMLVRGRRRRDAVRA